MVYSIIWCIILYVRDGTVVPGFSRLRINSISKFELTCGVLSCAILSSAVIYYRVECKAIIDLLRVRVLFCSILPLKWYRPLWAYSLSAPKEFERQSSYGPQTDDDADSNVHSACRRHKTTLQALECLKFCSDIGKAVWDVELPFAKESAMPYSRLCAEAQCGTGSSVRDCVWTQTGKAIDYVFRGILFALFIIRGCLIDFGPRVYLVEA